MSLQISDEQKKRLRDKEAAYSSEYERIRKEFDEFMNMIKDKLQEKHTNENKSKGKI